MHSAHELPSARVVVVEDDPAISTLLQEVLEASGLRVDVFTSAFEALASLRRELPAVLVLDWHLPEMDGAALLVHLREFLGRLPPVLVLTGDVRLRAPSCVAEILRKPVSLSLLVDRVRSLAAADPRWKRLA